MEIPYNSIPGAAHVDGEVNAQSQSFVGNPNGNGRGNNYENSDYSTEQEDEVCLHFPWQSIYYFSFEVNLHAKI